MDPHKRSATIEVLNERKQVDGGGRFPPATASYRDMPPCRAAWPQRVWAVEGANGIDMHLAQRLVTDGEQVVDVPAKLSARVQVFSTARGRKTDVTDAHSIALAAARTRSLQRVGIDENVALRLLVERRDELGAADSEGQPHPQAAAGATAWRGEDVPYCRAGEDAAGNGETT